MGSGTEEKRPDHAMLSSKEIPNEERLIVALDVDNRQKALAVVRELGDSVVFYKMGLQLFMSGGYFELLEELAGQGKKVFVDLKFYDVPETVGAAIRQLKDRQATFVTVHGHEDILRAAVKESDGVRVLAVTVLTSLDQTDLQELLGREVDLHKLVQFRARKAVEIGCYGVVSSGLEAPSLRREFGDRITIVTPGIRDSDDGHADGQKRKVSAQKAFLNGADYIVVGRPILRASDPRRKAEAIQRVIADVFSGRSLT